MELNTQKDSILHFKIQMIIQFEIDLQLQLNTITENDYLVCYGNI